MPTRISFAGTLLVLLAGVMVLPCRAQITGDIQVRTLDPSGATVPKANVTARSVETGTTRSLVTSADGVARFSQLAIGTYDIKVDAPGFASFQTQAAVSSGSTTTLPITLQVSKEQQVVTVTEMAQVINTENAQLQSSTASETVASMPLGIGAGATLVLAGTAPGVTPVTPRNPFLGLGSFNSNGGRGRGNNITLDNATATDVSTTGGAGLGTLPLDAVKEVTIVTNNFNAEYGRNGSAQFQILSKGGTNDYHGDLFEFFRNNQLNTRDYFDRTGHASILHNNDWGAVGGGPIKKDRVFWFGTYEQQKIRGAGGTRTATVPTPAQVAAATDPTAVQLLKQLQVPTSASGTVTNPAPLGTDFYAFSGRIDANITANDYFYMRAGMDNSVAHSPGNTFISSNLPTNGAYSQNRPINATVSETHIFGPGTVNQFLASFGRSAPVFPPLMTAGGPEIDFSDGTSAFGTWAGLPQGRVQNTFQYQDTLSKNLGQHQLKFGAEVDRVRANSFFDANVHGVFTFVTLSDFLNGKPFGYVQRFGNSVRGNREWNEGFFAQDDFRVTQHLTLNFGVRLEVAGGVTEINNILSNLDLNSQQALGGAGTGPLGGFDVGGASFKTSYNWAPRFGFAWNPGRGKLVVRGGYGIAYDFIYLNPITNMRFLPPFMYQFSIPSTGFTGSNTFANIIAGSSAFQQTGFATVGNFGTTIKNFGALSPVDQGLRNPQIQQWNFTVQRELPFGLVASAAYVGTKGNYLQRSKPINTLAPGRFTPPTTPDQEAAMRAAGAFTAINAGLNAPPTSSGIRIDPRFNGVTMVDSSANSNYHSGQFSLSRGFRGGYGFQVNYTISKTIDDISDALGVLATDVALQQNPFNNRDNRGVAEFDVPQRLVVTHSFTPKFTSRISNHVLRAVADGWTFSGIFQAQSGFPVNIFSGSRAGLAYPLLLGIEATGTAVGRPNVVGPVNVSFKPNPGSGGSNPNQVTNSGLAQPLVGNFGNLGRNVFRLNPLVQTDWTLSKTIKIKERYGIQFQAQCYNVFNNTTFSRPGQVMSAPSTFGYYADTDTDTRNFTLVMRFSW